MSFSLAPHTRQFLSQRHLSIALGVLLVLSGLQFFLGLGGLPLLGPDEPRYAEVAREMFVSGDYVSPRLAGELWFEKPALLYWAQAAAYHIFGVNEFAARFPSALSALLTLLAMFFVISRAVSLRWGLMSALVLATMGIWLGFARGATTDMILAATIAIAVLAGYASTVLPDKQRRDMLWLCAAAIGLAMLAKGLVGVLFVVLILGIHGAWTRRFPIRRWSEAFIAGAIFLSIIATWYVPVTMTNGQQFIEEFFVNHHFKRYLTNEYQHPQPFYFYFAIALIGAVPWSFFILPAIARLRCLRPRDNERDALLVLAWIWLLVPLLFFSLSGSKLPGYLLPSFPALAIILGAEAERLWNGEKNKWTMAAAYSTFALLLISGAACGVYIHRKAVLNNGATMAVAGLLLAAVLVALAWRIEGRSRAAVLAPLAMTPCVVIVAVTVLFTRMYEGASIKPLSLQINTALEPQENIVLFHRDRQYGPVFYNEGRIKFYDGGAITPGLAHGDQFDEALASQLIGALQSDNASSIILIASPKRHQKLRQDARFQTQVVGQHNKSVALRVRLAAKSR